MNIQRGGGEKKTVSSAVRVAQAVDKAIPELVFHLSYSSQKILQLCLLLFVLTFRQEGRIFSTLMLAERPLANGTGTERRFYVLTKMERGGERKKNGWITR